MFMLSCVLCFATWPRYITIIDLYFLFAEYFDSLISLKMKEKTLVVLVRLRNEILKSQVIYSCFRTWNLIVDFLFVFLEYILVTLRRNTSRSKKSFFFIPKSWLMLSPVGLFWNNQFSEFTVREKREKPFLHHATIKPKIFWNLYRFLIDIFLTNWIPICPFKFEFIK